MLAVIAIALSFILYTIAVWISKNVLKNWHLLIFWSALILNAVGALGITNQNIFSIDELIPNYILIATIFLILLMHVLWVTIIKVKDIKINISIHKLSLLIWLTWTIILITDIIFNFVF